jgi:DNA (cytosine-5)-methyltransferase 1
MKKMGSLFDGIGGFPLAAQRHGINPVWASEIEKWPIKVTKKTLSRHEASREHNANKRC